MKSTIGPTQGRILELLKNGDIAVTKDLCKQLKINGGAFSSASGILKSKKLILSAGYGKVKLAPGVDVDKILSGSQVITGGNSERASGSDPVAGLEKLASKMIDELADLRIKIRELMLTKKERAEYENLKQLAKHLKGIKFK